MKLSKKFKNLPIKRVLSVLLVAALFVVSPSAPFALSAASPTSAATALLGGLDTQDAQQGPATIGLQITGQIPTAQTGNSRLNTALEERWEEQRNTFLQNHMTGALSINFSVGYFISGDFVSVAFVKEAASLSTTAVISTTVIDASTNSIITLSDINVNILQLINSHINDLIAARPHNFSSFSGIDANHPFYLDSGRLVIPFGSAGLISNERGIHEVSLSLSNIEEGFFPSNYFRVLPPSQYSTIMIRVGDVMRHFGYDINWDNDSRTATIYMNGTLVSTLVIGENAYYYRNGSPRELEVAPMIHDNLTYVPLSFFTEIVGIPTTVNSGGVTVSRYSSSSTTVSIGSVYHGLLVE